MSWLLGILRRIIGVGEEEETRPTNSTNRTVRTTAAAAADNRAVPTTTGAATAGNRAVPTTTTASIRDYGPCNDTSSSRRYAPTTTTAATASNRAVSTTTTTASNRVVPTTTTASNRDYRPYNDTSSSRRYAPTTTTTAATVSYRDVLTTTTASNRDYSPYNDTSSSRRYAPTTITTAATASNRDVPTTTTVSNRDYSPYNDTSSRSQIPTTTTAAATASYRNYSSYYDTSSTTSYVPTTTTTTTTTATTYPPLTRQASDPNTVTQNLTPNYSNSQNSTPTNFPESLNFYFASSSMTVPSVSTPPSTLASSSSSSSGTPPSSPKPLRLSSKPFLSLAPSNPTHPNSKTAYTWVEKSTSPIYAIPKDIRDSIKKNVVPGILKRPLSPSTYKDYFEALLYAEDFYLERYNLYYDTSSTTSYVPTTTTTATTYPPLTRQASDPNTVTQNRTPNYSNSQNSTPTNLPEPLNFYFASSSMTVPSVSTPPSPPALSSSSSSGIPLSSPKPLRPSSKPFLSPAPSNPTDPNSKTDYILVEKSTSPIYAIPEDIRDSIKKNVVPGILKMPLSPSTYKYYFEALLYAEDFYLEKWDGFEMKNVTLELHEAAIYKRKGKYDKNVDDEKKDDKVFVTFELDSIPERRPFLLSRDFVSVWPSGTNAEPFQGLIYRVVKSNRVLVDFGEEFHDQHYSACKYNVKFSFNRVCLKRAHQAIATASDPLFRNFLFPDSISKNSLTAQLQSINSNLDSDQVSAVRHILSHYQNAIPYLVEGPISVCKSITNWSLSRTGFVVCEAVLQVYRTFPSCRILICAPTNNACDAITRNLKKKIPESDIFRANAAFREFDGVPEDILPSCHYKEERECFACPSLEELRKFKVISSTFMSSFRLHNEGIMAGHFSHIFLVDASSVIEPEAMVPLANLANESTAVTITGTPGNHSGWIRSHIARQNGLLMSYFERLRESKLYESLDPKLITQL